MLERSAVGALADPIDLYRCCFPALAAWVPCPAYPLPRFPALPVPSPLPRRPVYWWYFSVVPVRHSHPVPDHARRAAARHP